jgi:imidazolonepropionase-like amidohydrolase|tara:strand:+ start:2311 stop:3621 length:1311 start_codon:yes stop_codon:yes gene_type:complete
MNKFFHITLIIIFSFSNGISQVTPGDLQTNSVLLYGGNLHVGNGKVIEKSAIGFKDGIIIECVDVEINKIDTSKYDIVIDVFGKEVYPGFIAMNSTIGLMEVGAIRATKDYRETGKFNPNSRTLTSFNTDSRITPTVRSNGILLGQISPRGGIVSGSSSVMRFDSWNWEDAVVRSDEGIHMNWPKNRVNANINSELDIEKVKSKVKNSKNEIYDFFEIARAYAKKNSLTVDLRMEAMRNIFNGKKRLYVHADKVFQIKEIIEFKKEFNIEKLTIVGGKDAHYIPELIAENEISVIVSRVHSLPSYKQSELDISYKLPSILNKAGILFCFDNQGDMEQMQSRNIPFLAGTAVAYGLPYEEAIKALTLNCAKILEINNYGLIAKGKSATLFVSQGDALEISTNKIIHAFIDGRKIDLSNDQKKNYLKYCEKYGLDPEN